MGLIMKVHYKRDIYKELDNLVLQADEAGNQIKYIGLNSEDLQLLENEEDLLYSITGGRIYVDTESNKKYKGVKEAIIAGGWTLQYKGIAILFEE